MSPPPSDIPRLPKWPFLIGDAALLGLAWILVTRGAGVTPAGMAVSLGCVFLAALLGMIPFLLEYGRRQDQALDERQQALESLARTVNDSAEQISIAARGLQAFTDVLQKSLQLVDNLPAQLQEKIDAFHRNENEAIVTEKKALEKEIKTLRANKAENLENAGDKILKTAAELSRLEATIARRLKTLEAARTDAVSTPSPAPTAPATPSPREKSAVTVQSSESDATSEPPATTESSPDSDPAPAPAPSARKKSTKKSPSKKAATEAEPDRSDEESNSEGDGSDDFVQTDPDESAAVRSVSADGATRLLVTAYIGIGNRLFIRGQGPGLNWDQGVPLQFVSIGKWRWETSDAAAPIRARLYKNDEIECTALGEITLDAGHQTEVKAAF